MSERLFFILPGAPAAEAAVQALKSKHDLTDENIALLASPDTDLADLPEASPDEASDFLPALARGTAVGGTAGLLAGLTAVSIPAAGLTLGGSAVLAITGLGAVFGGWASALVGASVPAAAVEEFQAAIESGKVLLMVDTTEDAQNGVVESVRAAVPEAKFRGNEDARS